MAAFKILFADIDAVPENRKRGMAIVIEKAFKRYLEVHELTDHLKLLQGMSKVKSSKPHSFTLLTFEEDYLISLSNQTDEDKKGSFIDKVPIELTSASTEEEILDKDCLEETDANNTRQTFLLSLSKTKDNEDTSN